MLEHHENCQRRGSRRDPWARTTRLSKRLQTFPVPASVRHDAGVYALAQGFALSAGIAFIATPAAGASNELGPLPRPDVNTGRAAGDEPREHGVDAGETATDGAQAGDIASYTLFARLDPAAHVVTASGTIRWRNSSRVATQELWVHLYMNAFKNARSAFLRERSIGGRGVSLPRSYGGIEVRQFTWTDRTAVDLWPNAELTRNGDSDETDVRVPLPRAVAPGECIELHVDFEDKLPSIVERTGFQGTFHLIGQWFPKIARLEPDGTWRHFPFHHLSEFYADFGTYDVTLDVPESFVVGATGKAISERIEGGRRIERHWQPNVHDFAWTAWDAFRTMRETIDGANVALLYPPGFEDVASREIAALRFALPYFSGRLGPYPYSELTVVTTEEDAAEAGGMEYPTFITVGAPWYEPRGLLTPEIVAVHELAHQWFQGVIATDEAAWPFLDEGLAQYSEADAMGKWRGAGSCVDGRPLTRVEVSDSAWLAAIAAIAPVDEPIAQPASSFSTGQAYSRLVYARTATLLETLSRVYGDNVFANALGSYAREYRFQHPGPPELLDTFERLMGPTVAQTLRTALFEKGWVDYAVDSVASSKDPLQEIPVQIDGGSSASTRVDSRRWNSSVLVRHRGTISFPVDVEFSMSDGTTRREHWSGDTDWKRFQVIGATPVRAATIDPDDRVLLDADPSNNRSAAPDSTGGALRTLEWATYLMQLALQTAVP